MTSKATNWHKMIEYYQRSLTVSPCLCGDHATQGQHLYEEFVDISRLLILAKLIYYYPDRLDPKVVERWQVSDEHYDSMEQRYLQLCGILGWPNELVHKNYPGVPEELSGTGMMEVSWEHSGVQEVLEKFGRRQQ